LAPALGEYMPTSREISIAKYKVPVTASMTANVRATLDKGVMSPKPTVVSVLKLK
jgi:hypothetical protein